MGERYARRAEEARLPTGQEAQAALARTSGVDGYALFAALDAADPPALLHSVPAVETLRRGWLQNDYLDGDEPRWRTEALGIPPAAQVLNSLYDLNAHLGKNGSTCWVGYEVALTETCEEDSRRATASADSSSTGNVTSAVTRFESATALEFNAAVSICVPVWRPVG